MSALIEAAQHIENNQDSRDLVYSTTAAMKRKDLGQRYADDMQSSSTPENVSSGSSWTPKAKKPALSRARELRLAQNRKAARESRKRKKTMVEELQRSLIFFSKANQALKEQNEELTRRVLQAHSELSNLGLPLPSTDLNSMEKSEPVVLSPNIIPNISAFHDPTKLQVMEPGATMQAMANFQQAAAAAMEAAARGLQAKGVNFGINAGN